MKKHDFYMRVDFYKLNKIKEVRAEENGADLVVAYVFLLQYADEEGYICNADVPEIAEELGFSEMRLRGLIDRLEEFELAERDLDGFWLADMADFE